MHHPTSGCETRANPSFGTLVQSIWVAVRWIVLSDLHLGADQSVLTADDGGWVNETATVQRTQGAQAILVDDQLSVVAVELYRQTANADAFRVRVREPLVDDAAHHAFHAVVDARVRPLEHPFIDFSSNVAAELVGRRRALTDLYAGYR